MNRIVSSLALPVSVLLFLSTSAAQSQDSSQPRVTIPEAGDNGETRLTVNGDNAVQLKNIIVPELFPFVKENRMSMRVARSLRHDWKLDAAWEEWSRVHAGEAAFFLKNDPAKEEIYLKRGFPFGRSGAISQTPDTRFQAQKVLWNAASIWWGQRLVEAEMTVRLVEGEVAGAASRVTLDRIYPLIIDENAKTLQLFREIVRFTEPAALKSFSFLTFRPFPLEEDMLWVFSPALSRVRQLTGSNRGDPLLIFALSLDDMFGWSGNIRMVDADITASREALIPFSELNSRSLKRISADEKDNICVRVSAEGAGGTKGFAEWDLESSFTEGGIPLPVSSVFVPRQVWRLELSSKDPYALAGRQILYVDQEMMLPVVNIVFDRGGRLWKIVLTGFGLAEGEGRRAPFQAFQTVVDVRENRAVLNTTDAVMHCDSYQPGIAPGDFDPSRLK